MTKYISIKRELLETLVIRLSNLPIKSGFGDMHDILSQVLFDHKMVPSFPLPPSLPHKAALSLGAEERITTKVTKTKKTKPSKLKEVLILRPTVFAYFNELAKTKPNFRFEDIKLRQGWRKAKIQALYDEYTKSARN